ncbi:MAG: cupredoxin domain-containing protein [Rhodospirillaceae bacterium]|nr:cupredoxin domain-containing protein [Rhodospirillaceae bacterium]
MTVSRVGGVALLVLGLGWPALQPAQAEDLPTFRIELKDGVVTPQRLEVPANTRFKLEIANTGTKPAEFESVQLRKEKVLAPGASSFMVIRDLDPGEYDFFDDFNPTAPRAVLVAK